ncbi:dihydropteroate synthase [Alteromonas sp. C1M14]|uniref:dihydropteroate synthase n=1 Tax=Alteromonas sp. C1M14 TaxID=2841567 RepID=UPI001C09941A|nr:dihydropteroate synthase [Alteromonas sp. C1M14]MBU2977012.1 dihydropteroate synthase [Alteromonas sp. C1M14]
MHFKHTEVDLLTSHVMGILNVTPDSFSDGGRYNSVEKALDKAKQMVEAGATFIDIGGESTRPGAPAITEQEELDRVIPVVERLSNTLECVLSVDTSNPVVMTQAVSAGVGLINDVRALQVPGALEAAAKAQVPVCLMHMKGEPTTMQAAPSYEDVADDVINFLLARVDACKQAGIDDDKILLDPGFGFGKTLDHNYQLLAELGRIQHLGYPLLVGMSRKSMIGALTGKPVEQRLAGSIALATLGAHMGAKIIRVHDVDETVDAIKIVTKIQQIKETIQGA